MNTLPIYFKSCSRCGGDRTIDTVDSEIYCLQCGERRPVNLAALLGPTVRLRSRARTARGAQKVRPLQKVRQ